MTENTEDYRTGGLGTDFQEWVNQPERVIIRGCPPLPPKRVLFRELHRPFDFRSPFDGAPFVALIHALDPSISNDEMSAICAALVTSNCRYAVCAGLDCGLWHDSVDWAHCVWDPEYTDEKIVMTTWHEDDPIEYVMWYALCLTDYGDLIFTNYLVLFVGHDFVYELRARRAALEYSGVMAGRSADED